MGTFRLEITGVGGHGCARGPKDGDSIEHVGCGNMRCPDCLARALVETYKRLGFLSGEGYTPPLEAKFTHWPGTPEAVVDDLLHNVRRGSFS
jgi:hypothetical protein